MSKRFSHLVQAARAFWLCILLLAACQPAAPGSPPYRTTLEPATASAWRPEAGQSWQYDFSSSVDITLDAEVFILDLFETSPDLIEQAHAAGKRVVCYISAGSWEDWRPDKDRFPGAVIGKDYLGWRGEKWLDIRQLDVIGPIMQDRLDLCSQKGFDGVDPDNIDIHSNDSGFDITIQDQNQYAVWLSEQAHQRGLAIGMKNAEDQVPALLPFFDFAVIEDCFVFGWCEAYLPFIQAGKPVFAVEYTETGVSFERACQQARAWGFSLILKHRRLDTFQRTCP